MRYFALLLLLGALPGQTQELKSLHGLDRLAAKAVQVVDVNLDPPMLQVAARFLSSREPEEAQVKKLIGDLEGIYVKSFQFANEGAYSPADVELLRSELSPPTWSRIVGIRSGKDGETAEVYVKKEGDRIMGLAVLSAEPKQLTIAHIAGPIDMDQLAQLGGQFGVPKVSVPSPPK